MASSHPDDFQVIQSLQRILESSDLTKLTRKEVRKQLEQELGGSFSSPQWKARIKQEIEEFVRRKESGINNHSNPLPTNQPNKRRKLNDNINDSYLSNNNNNIDYDTHRKKPRLQSTRQLIQKSDKDNSYFMKLPGDGAKKRCIIHKYRRRLYVGFREYYDKNGEELPSKKGINLSEEQFLFVVKHIDDINA
eukprot:840685_1